VKTTFWRYLCSWAKLATYVLRDQIKAPSREACYPTDVPAVWWCSCCLFPVQSAWKENHTRSTQQVGLFSKNAHACACALSHLPTPPPTPHATVFLSACLFLCLSVGLLSVRTIIYFTHFSIRQYAMSQKLLQCRKFH